MDNTDYDTAERIIERLNEISQVSPILQSTWMYRYAQDVRALLDWCNVLGMPATLPPGAPTISELINEDRGDS